MSEIETCAEVEPEQDKCKRKVQLTAKALTYKLEQLQKEQKRNVNVIKSEDVRALQDYSLFLRSCCNSMEDIQCFHELDTPSNMLTVVKKLPYKLRGKWRSEVCELQEAVNQRATFSDIVNFIERQVKIMTDTVFGDIQDGPALTGSKLLNKGKSQSYLKSKRSSFATTVTAMEIKSEIGTNKK